MDPVTASLVLGGANFLGGLLGGASQSKMSSKELAQRGELGRRGLGIQETQLAPGITHLLETSGLRDKILHTLMARMGQAPQPFNPTDILGGTNFRPQLGGIDMGKLQGQMNSYTPGAGGVNPDMYKAMLARLGYMSPTDPKTVLTNQAQNQTPTTNIAPPAPSRNLPFDIIKRALGGNG